MNSPHYCPNCLDELVEVEVEYNQHENLVCSRCIKIMCFHKAYTKTQALVAEIRRMEARKN